MGQSGGHLKLGFDIRNKEIGLNATENDVIDS